MSLAFALVFALSILFIAALCGFFHVTETKQPPQKKLSFIALLLPFFLFFTVHVIAILITVNFFAVSGERLLGNALALHFVGNSVLLIALTGYSCCLFAELREIVWGRRAFNDFTTVFKALGFGVMTLLVSYPVMLVVSQTVQAIMSWIGLFPEGEQVAVVVFKQSLSYPYLFWFMLVDILFFSPWIEELLFRGFLQQWLKNFVGTKGAVLLASISFALFHLSLEQGWANIELFAALLTLSLFLGFLFERQQSLLAPLALHIAFNGVNALLIILS